MEKLRYQSHSISPADINQTIALQIQNARTRGWYETLRETRSREDIDRWLGGNDQVRLEQFKTNLRKAARRGHLALAVSADKGIVGYAIGANEVSPLPGSGETTGENITAFGKRTMKRAHHLLRPYVHFDSPSKVYAKLWNVAVDPRYWGQEAGARLTRHLYDGFRADQIPTAYVFEEDAKAMEETPLWGYHREPPDQAPTPKYDYFGKDQLPVLQYRFAADSVEQLRASLDAYIFHRP